LCRLSHPSLRNPGRLVGWIIKGMKSEQHMARQRVQESQSRRFALDRADLRKLGTGFLVALVGATATFLSDAATSLDFGIWSPFLSMGVSVLVNAIRKWIADNSPPSPETVQLSEQARRRPSKGWTTEAVILVLTAVTIGILALVWARGTQDPTKDGSASPAVVVPAADREAVVRAFVLQRQLFARVCLEAARRERAGLIASEEAENAWCEPRWAAARTEAFGLLAEVRDRQLRDGWTAESSARGLEAWAVVADPALAGEVGSR
jgi:hypothetical protein